MTRAILGIIVAAALIIGSQSVFTVDEREQALVLQFGDPRNVVTEAGLQVKLPFIQQVVKYDKRILEVDPAPERLLLSSESTSPLLMSDKARKALEKGDEKALEADKRLEENVSGEPILVDTFARYLISDPLLFRQRLGNVEDARVRLQNTMNTVTRNILGNTTLRELLSEKRDDLMSQIKDKVNSDVQNLGVEIVDIRIGRTDLTQGIQQRTFQRMISERKQRATELRALGKEQAAEIRANADRERTIILSKAEQEAQEIRGTGDRSAIQTYADAYKADEEFYAFYRSLEAYRNTLAREDGRLLLTPEGEFFRYFKDMKAQP